MALFYPHKGTMITLLVCILVIIGFATYVFAERNKILLSFGDETSSAPLQIFSSEAQFASSTDWKRAFPVLTGTASSKKNKDQSASAESSVPDTLTDQFGQSFFTRFMQLQQNGLTDSESAIKSTIDQSIDDLVFTAQQPKLYTIGDIKISSNTSIESIRAYGNALGAAFYAHGPRENSIAIATVALEKNDMALLAKLDSVTSAYATIISNYLSLNVPEIMADRHLELLNGLSSMLYVNQGLRNIADDPVQSLLALAVYNSAEEIFRESLIGIDDALFMQGINFTASEPGRVFSTVP